ncbi:hypothetical protein DFH06DRAFT_1141829 [Mycena polygramma]|nr:hypothetical protein DFH06DRAFT_1141829 [Mycena polygramma]
MKHLADLDVDLMTIVETGNKKNWRLCARQEEDGVSDEVIFRVQGILLKNNLTPKNTATCPPRKIPFICQHLEISGLKSETFRLAIAQIEEVNQQFHEHFSGSTVLDLARPVSSLGPGLGASNRLFTMKADAPTEQDTEFVDGLDPTGSLEKLKTRDLIHAPENMVSYFRYNASAEAGEVSYERAVPGAFKVGDIVELQMCFVAIQTAHFEIKVTTRLQAVTLLDGSFTKSATSARNLAKVESKPQKAVRRKVGYFYEDEEAAKVAKKKAREEDAV